MEENEKNQTNETNFKAVQNPNTYKSLYTETKPKAKVGFGKTVFLPFVSGIVGCGVVLRYMFWCTFYSFKIIRYKNY